MDNLVKYIVRILAAASVIFALLVTAADNLPAAPAASCSCAGKGPDCKTFTLDVDGTGENLGYCATWSERESCCLVMSRD